MNNPTRGEIWLVNFDPQIGPEIMKTRPALVLSSILLNGLPTRIIVPIRERKPHHNRMFFLLEVKPSKSNGLSKLSSLDCAQIKSFALERFVKKLGLAPKRMVSQAFETISACLEE